MSEIINVTQVKKEIEVKIYTDNKNLHIMFDNLHKRNDMKVVSIPLNTLFYTEMTKGTSKSLDEDKIFIELVTLKKYLIKRNALCFSFSYDYTLELNNDQTKLIITIRLNGKNAIIRKIYIGIPELDFLKLE